ncbi:recombinase family protein [Priestia flexa]|uniref:Recombinase family protein n=1 Tax=Priestia flexa TaxID=86664 RepID=A0A8I1SQN4_9BACI|nr:recombinase family protein [Priestia flexa]MBN8253581.1 recombinase family protein [Priestia flexa]
MKCIVYVRVSTDEQAKHGFSIAAQIEKLEAYCISQGWELVDKYIDEGYSAKDLQRPAFEKMMDKLKQGNIDVLLVYRLDRLTRSVMDLYKILKILDDNNCMFKSATEVYDTTNAMGRLFITLVAAIAQWERENLGERVRLGMEKKTKLGMWKGGMAPYGYKIVEKKLVINDKEKAVVQEIFQQTTTFGFYTLAKHLTNKGFSTRKGGEWHVDSVRDIANNPVYAGYLTFNQSSKDYKKPPREQTLYEGSHEPIISKDEFWALQDLLDKRRNGGGKKHTSNYYFSTLLKCARCGHSLSGHKSAGKKTYRCSGKKAGKNCTSHIILEDNLTKTIFSMFDNLVGNIYNSTDSSNYSDEKINELTNELKNLEKLLAKQKTMYENDIIDIDELIKKSNQLREREKKINKELKRINQSSKTANEETKYIISNIDTVWEYSTDHERKQLMNSIFTQIVIDTKEEYKRGTGKPREIIIVSAK